MESEVRMYKYINRKWFLISQCISIDFAQLFLNEISSENPCAIFDRERLRYAHVLELG